MSERRRSNLCPSGIPRLAISVKKKPTHRNPGVSRFRCVGLLANGSPGRWPDYPLFSLPRVSIFLSAAELFKAPFRSQHTPRNWRSKQITVGRLILSSPTTTQDEIQRAISRGMGRLENQPVSRGCHQSPARPGNYRSYTVDIPPSVRYWTLLFDGQGHTVIHVPQRMSVQPLSIRETKMRYEIICRFRSTFKFARCYFPVIGVRCRKCGS